tara:strand:+ start:112 stop:453 length:342 start_codon:yes stop_codon:yes gene_type:complete
MIAVTITLVHDAPGDFCRVINKISMTGLNIVTSAFATSALIICVIAKPWPARQHAITLMLRMPGTHKEDGARVFPEITETMDDESRRALKATGWLSGFRYKQDINLLVFLLSA